jgi:hypothetical protein
MHTARIRERQPSVDAIHTWFGSCGRNSGGTDRMNADAIRAVPRSSTTGTRVDTFRMSNPYLKELAVAVMEVPPIAA